MRSETKTVRGCAHEIVTRLARFPFRPSVLIDVDDGSYSVLLRWTDDNGDEQEYSFVLGEHSRLNSPVFSDLERYAKGGFSSMREFKQYIDDAIDAPDDVVPRIRSTRVAGWRAGSYTANGWALGDAPLLTGRPLVLWGSAGDKDLYKERMRDLLIKNPAVAFICGYFVAGSLVRLVGAENFILGVIGKTSVGKTLAIRTALSLRGDPRNFATFDSTEKFLVELCQQAGDACVPVDEVGQAGFTPEKKQQLIYNLSQGKRRGRLSNTGKVGTSSIDERMYYNIIITGEESILPANAAAGTTVRVTEMIFDAADPDRRVWESITTAAEAEAWESFIVENHGFVMPEIIETINKDRAAYTEQYSQLLVWLRAEMSCAGKDDNATQRKLKTFALALVGAQLLDDALNADSKIGPYGAAGDFAIKQLKAGIATVVSKDDDRYADFLLSLPVRYSDRMFNISATDDENHVRAPVGAARVGGEVVELRILTSALDALCAKEGLDAKRLLAHADKAGWLQKVKNGTAPNGQPNYVSSRRIQCGPAKAACYQFLVPSPLDELPD